MPLSTRDEREPTPGLPEDPNTCRCRAAMSHVVIPGAALAIAVVLLALWFAGRQWRERKRRPDGLSAADLAYFRAMDHRRLAGSLVMALVSAGMAVGLIVDPRRGLDAARIWVAAWSTVLCLLLVLLALAGWDWLALHAYAHRQRLALRRERDVLMNDLARLAHQPPHPTNGEEAEPLAT